MTGARQRTRRVAHALSALLAVVFCRGALGQVPAVPPHQLPVPPVKAPQAVPKAKPKPKPKPKSSVASSVSRWFNPATAPFIPIPEVAADPDNGTTVGLIPTWLKADQNNDVRQIIAPDMLVGGFVESLGEEDIAYLNRIFHL